MRSLAAFLLLTAPAFAETYQPITDRTAFVDIIAKHELRIGLYNLSLTITPKGQITGSALGWQITGDWTWKDGYFCRKLDWSGTPIPYNCQLVEAKGTEKLRFTTDKGAGDSAAFDLR
ncbi:dihydrodipicolinate reductase [Cypionkella sp. TWP1-2-1b2]|uniref:dihydrodipicolinate reductase n=1 Tax=Cypionkella sp. TWP1-2-1b2 TaxID=2804675 RepID=UPI003CF447AF